ncbi:MAG: hypothetical protein ACK4SZ_09715 [Allosphingosinicella sp.]|uniref:hypothetical protein n=1 Tax=Allosphingosinicella sp. TaxID=2823234 RepID=UPI003961A279
MPTYRLLFFRANLLERWEEIEAPDYVEAVQQAAQRPSDDRVELWREGHRLASFRPHPTTKAS